MEIRIAEDNWIADILLTPADQMLESRQCSHLQARIKGNTEEDARKGAQFILNLFAKGRNAYIRDRPETDTATNFDSKVVVHHGWVNFSFRLERGEWHDLDKSYKDEVQISGFGVVELGHDHI
jgi:hypothetical protein